MDNAIWLFTDASSGTVDLADKLKDMSSYYLVEYANMKLLVNVTKDFIISQRLYIPTDAKKLQIGENIFTKANKINVTVHGKQDSLNKTKERSCQLCTMKVID